MKCESQKCKNNAPAIIRTFSVCDDCFKIYKKDNVDRMRRGIKIPKKLILLKEENAKM